MPAIPSYCPHCDHTFQNNAIRVTNSTNVTLSGCKTNCPQCGRMVGMLEGTFDATPDGRIDMKSGMPPITRGMLEKFDLLTRNARRYDLDLPNYAIESAAIHPAFGHVVSEAAKAVKKIDTEGVKQHGKKHVLKYAVLSFILTAINSCDWDGNELLRQTGADQVIKYQVTKLMPSENKPNDKNDGISDYAAGDKTTIKQP